jgi:hypothetical protein
MRAWLRTALLVSACVAAACHDPDKYLLAPGRADEALRFEPPSPATLPADGVSRVTIVATLAEGTAVTNRKVTFKTTMGSLFAGTPTGGPSVTVEADLSGRAVAELQSETRVGTARVEASAGPTDAPIVRTLDIPFVAPAPDSVFKLSAVPESIPADGFSRATIRAELLPSAGTTQRTVTFEAFTTGLLFAPGESAGGLRKTVTANSDGVATVSLQSSRNLETARVQATALGVTREIVVTFSAASPGDIIRVARSAATAPADGASIVRITATIAPGLPEGRRGVRFTTTLGFFENQQKSIDLTADGANTAVADLRTEQTTGVANIRATLIPDGVSAPTSVEFVQALPDRIFVSADDPQVSASAGTPKSTIIRAQLLRNIGKATDKTLVVYTATNAAGGNVGTFSKVELSNPEGLSTATFTPGPSATPGIVTIRATVNGTVVGSTTIEVVP